MGFWRTVSTHAPHMYKFTLNFIYICIVCDENDIMGYDARGANAYIDFVYTSPH